MSSSSSSSARANRLHAQAQAHLAAAQPDRAESLLRAALAVAAPADADPALHARLSALLADATAHAATRVHEPLVSAPTAADSPEQLLANLDAGERARLLINAATSAASAQAAAAAAAAAFGDESAAHALALSNAGVWLAKEGRPADAVATLRAARRVLRRAVGVEHGMYAALDANLRVLGAAEAAADEVDEPVVCDVDVARVERLDQLAADWAERALPGRCDPDGVVMDPLFTRRVLAHFFARQPPALRSDGRLLDWLTREATLHGLRREPAEHEHEHDEDDAAADENRA